MFVGHYSTAIAAKAFVPKAPFWLLMVSAQFVDIAWAIFILAGIEKMSLDHSLSSNPLVLEYIPYTHGLFPTFAWGLLAYLLVIYLLRLDKRVAIASGIVVMSHWVLDLIVHRPDLHVLGDIHIGLGLWEYPILSFGLELMLVGIATGYLVKKAGLSKGQKIGSIAFLCLLVGLQIYTHTGDQMPQTVEAFASLCLMSFLVVPYLAYLMVDRNRESGLSD